MLTWKKTKQNIPFLDVNNIAYSTFTCTNMTEPKCFWYCIAYSLGYMDLQTFAYDFGLDINGETIRIVHNEVSKICNLVSYVVRYDEILDMNVHYKDDNSNELIGYISDGTCSKKNVYALHIYDSRKSVPGHVELLVPNLANDELYHSLKSLVENVSEYSIAKPVYKKQTKTV